MSHLKALYCHVNLFLLPILQRTQRTVSFLYLPGSLSYCKTVITSHISFILSGFKLEVLQLSLTDIILSPCSPSLPLSAWSPGSSRFLPVLHQKQTQLWEEDLIPHRATSSESLILYRTGKGSFGYHCCQFFTALHWCVQSFLSVCRAFIVFALPPPSFFPEYFPKSHIHCEF